MRASGDSKRSKHAQNKFKQHQTTMQCKGKGTANHHKTELKPQVFPVRNVLTRA